MPKFHELEIEHSRDEEMTLGKLLGDQFAKDVKVLHFKNADEYNAFTDGKALFTSHLVLVGGVIVRNKFGPTVSNELVNSQEEVVLLPKNTVTEILTAFAEGVVWSEEQRAAYTKLAEVMGHKALENASEE
jgi:hypothetical protein